jgi:hypothetical protein
MVPLTALWAAVDSSKLRLRQFESGISCRPLFLFIGICLLWIVAFPWYLIVRGRIKDGVQQEKASIPTDVLHSKHAKHTSRGVILAAMGLLIVVWLWTNWRIGGALLSPVTMLLLIIFVVYIIASREGKPGSSPSESSHELEHNSEKGANKSQEGI